MNNAHGHAQKFIQRRHPSSVAGCQIIVNGNQVDTVARQRVQVRRQRCYQGFTFTGAHLGNHALMEHHATYELNVEVTHAQGTMPRFAHRRERLGQEVINGCTVSNAHAEFIGFCAQGWVV